MYRIFVYRLLPTKVVLASPHGGKNNKQNLKASTLRKLAKKPLKSFLAKMPVLRWKKMKDLLLMRATMRKMEKTTLLRLKINLPLPYCIYVYTEIAVNDFYFNVTLQDRSESKNFHFHFRFFFCVFSTSLTQVEEYTQQDQNRFHFISALPKFIYK